jgi:hypothetical protein
MEICEGPCGVGEDEPLAHATSDVRLDVRCGLVSTVRRDERHVCTSPDRCRMLQLPSPAPRAKAGRSAPLHKGDHLTFKSRTERDSLVGRCRSGDESCGALFLPNRSRNVAYPRHQRVSPDYSNHLSDVPCPLPRRIKRVHMSIASPLMQPSPMAGGSASALLSRGSNPAGCPTTPLASYRTNRQLSGY